MFKTVSKRAAALGAAILGYLSLSTAQAASMLPSDLTTTFDGVKADITTVGGALIGLAVVAMALKWVKATFF